MASTKLHFKQCRCARRESSEEVCIKPREKTLILAYPVFHELLRSCLLRFQPSSVNPSPALGLPEDAPGLFGEALTVLEDAWLMLRSVPDRSSVASAWSEEAPGWFGIALGWFDAAPGFATALLRASEAATTLLLTVLPVLISAGKVLAGTTSIPPVGLPAASTAGLRTYDMVTPSDCGVTGVEDAELSCSVLSPAVFSAEELVTAAAAGC